MNHPPRTNALAWLRGLLFNFWMAGSALALGVIGLPLVFMSERGALWAIRHWCRLNLAVLRILCGVRVEVRGLDKLPAGGALIAAKHQGMLDTIVPFALFPAPSIVLKKELLSIPIYGWYALRSGMIPIDRAGAAKALRAMIKEVRHRFDDGRQVLIFPEGTRSVPGDAADYKPGIAALFKELNVPCTPVATNSGMFWPARGLARHPGVAVFEVLEPIPPGLKRAAFMRELETRIEEASHRLLDESSAN